MKVFLILLFFAYSTPYFVENSFNLNFEENYLSIRQKMQQPISFEDCGGEIATVTFFDIEPNPPIIGQSVILKIAGNAKQSFVITQLSIVTYAFDIQIFAQKIPVYTSCPEGFCNFIQEYNIPSNMPFGVYQFEIKAQNEQYENLICGKVTVQLEVENRFTLQNQVDYSICDYSLAQTTKLDVFPFPPRVGEQLSISWIGQANEVFTVNKTKISIIRKGLIIAQGDIQIDKNCEVGQCNIIQNIIIPRVISPDNYDIKIQFQNDFSDNVICFAANAQISPSLQESLPFQDCGGDLASVLSLDTYPQSLTIGQTIYIALSGKAKEAFMINKIHSTIFSSGVPISTQSFQINTSCSDNCFCSLFTTLSVPSIIPEGNYQIQIKAQYGQRKKLMCGKTERQLKITSRKFKQAVDFINCGGDQGIVTQFDLSPYPPTIGQNVTFTVQGQTKSAFTVTKVKMTMYISGIPLQTKTYPAQIYCPAVICIMHQTGQIPNSILPGHYVIEFQLMNNLNNNLVCAKGTFLIK